MSYLSELDYYCMILYLYTTYKEKYHVFRLMNQWTTGTTYPSSWYYMYYMYYECLMQPALCSNFNFQSRYVAIYMTTLWINYVKVLDHYKRVFDCEHPLITDKNTEILDCIPCVMVILLHSASQALISLTPQQAHSVKTSQTHWNRQSHNRTDGRYQVYFLPCVTVNNSGNNRQGLSAKGSGTVSKGNV